LRIGQHLDAEFFREVSGVARQASLHRQENLTPQRDGIGEQTPILCAQIPKARLRNPSRQPFALGAWSVAIEAELAVIGDLPEPLEVAGIAFVGRLIIFPPRRSIQTARERVVRPPELLCWTKPADRSSVA
jgi:hypothetical protein